MPKGIPKKKPTKARAAGAKTPRKTAKPKARKARKT
jgi:hypothetical protein